jgi:cytochrome P450
MPPMEQPFRPAPAAAPLFDTSRNAWILSRYSDVCTALREPSLLQASPQGKPTSPDDGAARARLHAEVQTDISRMNAMAWHAEMESVLHSLLRKVDRGHSFDLVKEVLQPWSATLMVILSEAGSVEARQLRRIAEQLFFKKTHAAGPSKTNLGPSSFSRKFTSQSSKKAEAALDALFESRKLTVGKPMFSGLTQTLPSFLANAWLALLQNPDQVARLIENPGLMPSATEELLRYAGIVQTIFRHASKDVNISDASIKQGQFVILKIASANHDSARFDKPECLDVTRRFGGHVSLGNGVHACVGSVLVRMACMAITPIFLSAGPALDKKSAPVWTRDTTLRWPFVVPVVLQRK